MAEKQEKEEQKDKKIESYGQVLLGEDEHNGKIQLMTIIGEIEGMTSFRRRAKRQSTSIFYRSLHQLKTVPKSAVYCF